MILCDLALENDSYNQTRTFLWFLFGISIYCINKSEQIQGNYMGLHVNWPMLATCRLRFDI